MYADPNNPNVWCSLGVLYYQLQQNRDALDAYTRAIKLDPNFCEVYYNVGTLYDRCVWARTLVMPVARRLCR